MKKYLILAVIVALCLPSVCFAKGIKTVNKAAEAWYITSQADGITVSKNVGVGIRKSLPTVALDVSGSAAISGTSSLVGLTTLGVMPVISTCVTTAASATSTATGNTLYSVTINGVAVKLLGRQ